MVMNINPSLQFLSPFYFLYYNNYTIFLFYFQIFLMRTSRWVGLVQLVYSQRACSSAEVGKFSSRTSTLSHWLPYALWQVTAYPYVNCSGMSDLYLLLPNLNLVFQSRLSSALSNCFLSIVI